MTIQTIDELIDFIEAKVDKLSNKAYVNICIAIHICQHRKPDNKQIALKRIKEHSSLTKNINQQRICPFLLINMR